MSPRKKTKATSEAAPSSETASGASEPAAPGELREARGPAERGRRLYGVYPAIVVAVTDPLAQGRVKVKLPWLPAGGKGGAEPWARLATLMAGANRGSWFIPDVDDEVLVAFEAGDPRRPYVVGALWNEQHSPPETMDAAGRNHRKVLRSRNGVTITLDDTDGHERLRLETPGGHRITLEDDSLSIELRDANGNTIELEPGGVTIAAAARVRIRASVVEIEAGLLTVDSGLARFSGVVQADTVITNSVVSASYTPGAGNLA